MSLFDISLFDFGDQIDELNDGLALLQSPAARQMLIYQLQGTGTNISVLSNSLHANFLNDYKNMGYPQQAGIRNIAISSGAECGTPLDFDAYDNLVNLDEQIDLPFFVTNLGLAIVNGLSVNPLKLISSLLSTNTDIKAQFTCRALPSLQAREIYKGRVYIKKTILFAITVHEPLIDSKSISSASNMLALDNANGGVYDIDTFVNLPEQFDDYVLERRFNFVPTYSSLDVGRGNATILPADLTKEYDAVMPPLAPKDIPFDNFYANPIRSENHIQFTLNNGNWLMNELRYSPEITSCVLACDLANWEISGPDTFCGTGTYSLPAGVANYNWSFPGVRVVDPATPNVVTLQEWNNGYQTISATINLPECGIFNRRISKTVYVGVPRTGGNLIEVDPNTMLSIYPPGNFCLTTGVQIINWPDMSQVLEFEMRKVAGQSYWDGNLRGGRSLSAAIYSNCNELFEFEVRARNTCGWSEWEHFSIPTSGCLQNCGAPAAGNIVSSNFIISPVPASTVIAIDKVQNPTWTFYTLGCSDGIYDLGGSTSCPTYVSVKLYNFTGTLVIDKPSHQLGSSIDVSMLSPGTYIMHVIHDSNQLEVHQIPIN